METGLLKIDFAEPYDRLVKWFRVRMTTEQTTITYDKLKWYPLESINFAVDYFIDNGRPSPGSFPTTNELLSKVWEWLDNHPEEKFKRMQFDRVEDFKYPIGKLLDGFKILMNEGDEAFNGFADKNRMPKNDRERVRMKANVVRQGKEGDFNAKLASLTGKAGRPAWE